MLSRLRARRALRLTTQAYGAKEMAPRTKALVAAESWVAREPESAEARLNRAQVLLGIGETFDDVAALARALEDFEEVVPRLPRNALARFGAAMAEHGLGEVRGDGALVMKAIGRYEALRREPEIDLHLLAHVLVMEAVAWRQLEGPGGPPEAAKKWRKLREHAIGIVPEVAALERRMFEGA